MPTTNFENGATNCGLSFRERQVIGLAAQGKPNAAIAIALGLSAGTVKEYMHRIFRKLSVTSRTELAVWALKHPGYDAEDAA